MKFTIERSKWCRGRQQEHDEISLLRTRDMKMCCLGFFGLACGLKEFEIQDRADPADTYDGHWPAWALVENDEDEKLHNSSIIRALISINDDENISEIKREEAIKELFASQGVEVRFVD